MAVCAIRINSDRQNRTVHKARVEADVLMALATKAVAEQVGVDLASGADRAVSVRAYVSSYQEGSLGTSKPCVEVELIVDYMGSK